MSARLTGAASLLALTLLGVASARAAGDDFFIIDVPKAANSAPQASSPMPSVPQVRPPVAAATRQTSQPALKVMPLDDGERPDESALRYYVTLNQTGRANTEIQRLARLYPGWVPPVDLFEMDTSSRDEDVLWDLFAADKLTELRSAIAGRKREDPTWQPSKDLMTKLRHKEMRARVVGFWKDGRWQDLVDSIKTEGYDEDTDVDLLWTIAEAYGRTKQVADAVGVYRSILNSSNDTAARLATVQKAMAMLRMADVEPLIALGRSRPDGSSEWQPIMVDIVRQRISAYLHDERSALIAADELALFQDAARPSEDPNQPGLVAWYYYKIKDYRNALEWFKVALDRGGDAMIAHGLAHSLRALDMRRETEEVAYAWREPLVNNLILFIDILERDLTQENPPYIEPERLARYARVTMDVAAGEGAQGLAWYAYNSCQYTVAYEWFARAMAWLPKEATAYGYALTLRKLKRQKDFVDVVNRYDGLFPKVLDIVFPDDQYHPPTPCDLQAAQQLTPAQQNVQAPFAQPYIVPGSTPSMQSGYGAGPNMAAGYGAMRPPQPGAPVPGYGAPRLLKLDPKEFPVAVDPENPLRFYAAASGVRPGSAPPPVFPPPSLHEPWRGQRPLVANRVPGVGAMPYERYGFSLLPGWNGQAAASNPPASALLAPAGTLWASESDAKDRPRAAGLITATPTAALPTSVPASLPTSVPVQPSTSPPPVRVVGTQIGTAPPNVAPPAPPATQSAPAATPSATPPTGAPSIDTQAWAPQPVRPVLPSTTDPAVLAMRAQQFFNDKAYAEALDVLDQRAVLATETTDLRMIRGWSLLHLKRAEEARQVFAGLGRSPVPSGSRNR